MKKNSDFRFFSLNLQPSLRQIDTKYMTQSYNFQLSPVSFSYCCWYGILLYFIFGNSTIMPKHGGFFVYS